MAQFEFSISFKDLTGHDPFPWQRRLFDEYFSHGKIPPAIDIPTGLGKTAVIAVWLLARACGAPLPRRLVYVVDRRAVVDQATEFAETLRENLSREELAPVRKGLRLGDDGPLPISTLRGRHIDNREWMADPSSTAVIIGTVDMVGSRLLFSGYGVSRRMRPYVAGLLGCDTLVMLDEAHLARPFRELLRAVEDGRAVPTVKGTNAHTGGLSGPAASPSVPPPFHVLPLSATLAGEVDAKPFVLDEDDRDNTTVRTRLEASKELRIEGTGKGRELFEVLGEQAWRISIDEGGTSTERPPRVLIYCDQRRNAEQVEAYLSKRIREENNAAKTILFSGNRRVYEREMAAAELADHGFIAGHTAKPDGPVFLVATSAGEVGVDLDADHMVCDLVAWERMVQRLGRVNRRGEGAARIQVIDQGPPEHSGEAARHAMVLELLGALPPTDTGGVAASPHALAQLQETVGSERVAKASTPMPLHPALSRPLVDSWAMTSLDEHTGRPEVAPWLRGWVDEEPQTTVAWRRYLPLRFEVSGTHTDWIGMPKNEIDAFFEAAPLRTEELLETEAYRVAEWLKKRARSTLKALGPNTGEPTDVTTEGLQPITPTTPIAFPLSGSGGSESPFSLQEIDQLGRNQLVSRLTGRRLVVDARLGGIAAGLLDFGCNEFASTIEDNWGEPEETGDDHFRFRVRILDRDTPWECEAPWQQVREVRYRVSPEGIAVTRLVIEKYGRAFTDEDSRAVSSRLQALSEHQEWVATEVRRIAMALDLTDEDRLMIEAAARHHDDGKGAARWQRAFHAGCGGPYAKTAKAPNLAILNGYRHEFQSVLDAERNGLDGLERSDTRFELALHLIAAHHGHSRPAIRTDGCDSLPPIRAVGRAHEVAMRFARLQKQWGPWGLAWWEALLRAADQRASGWQAPVQISAGDRRPDGSSLTAQAETLATDLGKGHG